MRFVEKLSWLDEMRGGLQMFFVLVSRVRDR